MFDRELFRRDVLLKEMYMARSRKELGMKCAVCGAVLAVVLVIGLGSVAYAQEDTKSTEQTRVAGMSFFDPFLLTRVVLAPSSVRGVYTAATVRASNGNGNGNGNGNQPPGLPEVPGRPEFRSNWCPPFGWGPGGRPT
jgi:hypothetical protein